MITFNNHWTVKKQLAEAFRLKSYNEQNERNVFLNRSLNEFENDKFCLNKRYSFFQHCYIKGNFKISNLKLFYDGREIDTSK